MNFDRLAPHYDWMEAVSAGGRLQRARTRWLEQLAGCRNVLSVGEGHGRFAAALLERFPQVHLTCVEASAAMIKVGRRRTRPWQDRVQWVCAEALAWAPDRSYDAIVTCFFLDCFPAPLLARVIEHLSGAATPAAIWLVADFSVPDRGWARRRALAVHALMYAFFRVVVNLPARRLTPPDSLLGEAGFKLTARQDFEWGLVRAEVWRRE